MGNAAAMPISAKECEKYGITMDDVKGYNAVVKESKRKKKGKNLDKTDLDKIHKYCLDAGKKAGKGKDKGLHKLLEKQLNANVSATEMSVTQASTQYDEASILEYVPAMIEVKEEDDETSVLGALPESVEC
jgi:maleate cis-trans isomerase